MKKNIAMKWIKALESGDYKQTKHALRTDKGWCCLGVLCAVLGYKTNSISGNVHKIDGEINAISLKVMEAAGMMSNVGHLPSQEGVALSLATLNDTGKTFKKIAKVIRKNYREL